MPTRTVWTNAEILHTHARALNLVSVECREHFVGRCPTHCRTRGAHNGSDRCTCSAFRTQAHVTSQRFWNFNFQWKTVSNEFVLIFHRFCLALRFQRAQVCRQPSPLLPPVRGTNALIFYKNYMIKCILIRIRASLCVSIPAVSCRCRPIDRQLIDICWNWILIDCPAFLHLFFFLLWTRTGYPKSDRLRTVAELLMMVAGCTIHSNRNSVRTQSKKERERTREAEWERGREKGNNSKHIYNEIMMVILFESEV